MTRILPFDQEAMAEIDADAYFTALEALEAAERGARAHSITRAEIARRLGKDKATVTKILNGTNRNITLRSLFCLMKAMNRKVIIDSVDFADLPSSKPNFRIEPCTTVAPSAVYLGVPKAGGNINTYYVTV
jgi:transcriptional regulator with XRE-family HTH domain